MCRKVITCYFNTYFFPPNLKVLTHVELSVPSRMLNWRGKSNREGRVMARAKEEI